MMCPAAGLDAQVIGCRQCQLQDAGAAAATAGSGRLECAPADPAVEVQMGMCMPWLDCWTGTAGGVACVQFLAPLKATTQPPGSTVAPNSHSMLPLGNALVTYKDLWPARAQIQKRGRGKVIADTTCTCRHPQHPLRSSGHASSAPFLARRISGPSRPEVRRSTSLSARMATYRGGPATSRDSHSLLQLSPMGMVGVIPHAELPVENKGQRCAEQWYLQVNQKGGRGTSKHLAAGQQQQQPLCGLHRPASHTAA